MVRLQKPIRRIVECESNWLKDGNVVLTVYPDGYLGFRELRRRAEFKLSLKEAYRQAVLITTCKIAARTKELRKQGVRNATKQARKEYL